MTGSPAAQDIESYDARRRRARWRRAAGVAGSIIFHALVIVALIWATPTPPKPTPEPPAIAVELVDLPAPVPEPKPPGPKKPAHKRAAPRKVAKTKTVSHKKPKPAAAPVHKLIARHTPPHPARMTLAAAEDDAPPRRLPVMSEGELAGAATAGEGDDERGGGGGGGGGGRCDMARRIQAALRRDPMVHTAIANLGGKAIRVWNGEWVWMPGDIGQGLTAVRQAMEFEIAYAPEACRAQAVHGLVVFNLREPQGSVRLAFGVGDWRWTDLIGMRARR